MMRVLEWRVNIIGLIIRGGWSLNGRIFQRGKRKASASTNTLSGVSCSLAKTTLDAGLHPRFAHKKDKPELVSNAKGSVLAI